MPGQAASAGVLARIKSSAHTITVTYPPVRVAVTTGDPSVPPLAPLTGPAKVEAVRPATTTSVKPAVTINCLWYDNSSAVLNAPKERRVFEPVGWRQDAQALARVAVSDAALDAAKPYDGTIFDACDTVQHFGQVYRVLQVTQAENGSNLPATYYVWLTSRLGQ